MKKGLPALIVLVILGVCMMGLYRTFAGEGTEGAKEITLQVIHGDQRVHTAVLRTDRAYLGEALRDEVLIRGEEGAYGMFIKEVDGETADEAEQEWWCLTKGGETVYTSADSTPIADGEVYELTLMVGY